ncbi:hypothetical protein AYJ57_21640 (plasmid) [Salipiger sp. CCB-MM3]|uniref:hypothetical protein n=1 Tax=Salipiger sp. CCB-MM3 TaxID=1792508 RepID=UPI00080AA447|nr:hypothetical protein [Salipiger sp. CCB-MM3]ANT63077.1 hypothetical protein AYJ57_21640 [Salipiger sp. CCB-MM3]
MRFQNKQFVAAVSVISLMASSAIPAFAAPVAPMEWFEQTAGQESRGWPNDGYGADHGSGPNDPIGSGIGQGSTAAGKYQITIENWQNLGYVEPGASDWDQAVFTDKAVSMGVSSYQDLLASDSGRVVQDQMAMELAGNMWDSLSSTAKSGVGGQINEAGLLGGAWFLGPGAMNTWAEGGFSAEALGNLDNIDQILELNGFDSPAELQSYPIGDVDVSKDPRKLGDDHGVRTMVARNMVRSSLPRERQIARSGEIETFLKRSGFDDKVAKFVAGRNWTREIGPRFPGEKTFQESSTTQRMPDTVLLEKAVALGLGRPSTWANHIENFIERELCDENLQLTEKGQSWAAASPDELLNPRLSNLTENACEHVLPGMMEDAEREPWSILAEKISSSLPEGLSAAMGHDLEPEPKTPEDPYASVIARVEHSDEPPTSESDQKLAS